MDGLVSWLEGANDAVLFLFAAVVTGGLLFILAKRNKSRPRKNAYGIQEKEDEEK